jgi:hypothetical protein
MEARAQALECSVDWLLAEAMKRLLESSPEPERPAATPELPAPPLPAPAPPPPPALRLVVDGKPTRIDRGSFVIGRSARHAHLVLRDPGVSRQHAIVERHGAAYVIADMASANGVIVNGQRIARALLRPGDVVEIGPFAITVER